jgi:nicotinamidase/pyrazinamidase
VKAVFVDIDTQLDFLFPAGSLYTPGIESICGNLAKLTAHAARAGIPIISTMDAHAEDDAEFRKGWPHHCVKGALGQRKLSTTIAPRGQHFVEKQTFDCFSNPKMSELLFSMQPDRVYVYGVVTDVCVMHAVDGLLARNYQVSVVCDAIYPYDREKAEMCLGQWRMAQVKTPTTASLCG